MGVNRSLVVVRTVNYLYAEASYLMHIKHWYSSILGSFILDILST